LGIGRRDLDHFGSEPAESLPQVVMSNAAEACGAMWVIEEATLGGMGITGQPSRQN
jgi:heme oxygenase